MSAESLKNALSPLFSIQTIKVSAKQSDAMKPIKITSFEQIDALYEKGVNICKGCIYEHAASCSEGRFAICTAQANKIITHKQTRK